MTSEIPSIETRLGHAGWHDHEVRGVLVFGLDHASATVADLLLLTIGVPRTDDARAVIRLCAQAGLNPDPRIPPMKLVRLGAAYGNLLTGLATGFAGLQSSYVGMTAVSDAARFLCELQGRLGWSFHDDELDAILRERRRSKAGLFGFGVAGRPVDERMEWLATRLDDALHGPRPWWCMFERAATLLARYRRRPNLGGALAAALLDIGCTPEQAHAAACLFGLLPLLGNALEGSEQAPRILRELPATIAVDYVGAPARTSPRASRAAGSAAPRATSDTDASGSSE